MNLGYTPQSHGIGMLQVRVIGTFALKCDGKPVTLSSRAAQSLLAYLILTTGDLHRREKLAGMLWPEESEEKARTYLRNELWRIRKELRQISNVEYLRVDNLNIGFDPSSPYWLDVTALKNLSDRAGTDELISALLLYQGELLPGFYEDWVVLEREHLFAIYERRIENLLELLEDEKRWNDILEWAERWISLGQAPEAAYRALMIAYEALGARSKVTATYERCVQALHVLEFEPSEETRALASRRTSKLNIPIPLTSFVGREKELKEIAGLLSKSRLVTLTGAGGVGKTRVAIQVVAEILDMFPDGVWFLDLAPLSDSTLVPYALVNLLGLRESGDMAPTEILIDYFRTARALLIFDNCEHLIDSCAQLVNLLLISCENLSMLATSREALRIPGEIPYRVPSLDVPNLDIASTADALAKFESVRLFAERASAIATGLVVNLQNVLVIVQICQRLDGIPLAIELAAARTNVLTLQQILQRLDDRFNLLTEGARTALPRQQTLQATVEWSYSLLPEKERILFRRLATFSGGWSLESAEKVCSGDGIRASEVLNFLSQLVNKSLVVVEIGELETRYRRLEIIREFARQKLIEATEAGRLQDRHLAYFLTKAEEIELHLLEADPSKSWDYLDRELDNLRLALEWSISTEQCDQALRLLTALGSFWLVRGHLLEGIEWFQRALTMKEGTSKGAQAKALRHAGSLYFAQENFSAASKAFRESLALYRELGEEHEISKGRQLLDVLEVGKQDLAQGRALLEESLSIRRVIGNNQQ